ncbi:glycosyltransferase [Aurantibacter sp.]|uniref:glycosyltransferase n=1 Tax=Aurantibacter sp. TaxID=2807103 RepID=UPI003265BEE6
MQPKILFILHLPPPVHGASMVSKRLKNSSLINSSFSANYINLATSFNLEDIGKQSKGKFSALLKILKNITKALSKTNYDLCYMTLTSAGPGFYKDLLVVILLKLFRKKIVFHFHNKGVKTNSNIWYKRLCYRFVFHNTKCIMLSPLLYDDISNYVKSNDVYYCANGIPKIDITVKKEATPAICKFLFLSNMMEAKGVYTLLDACEILVNKNLKFECNFVGDWSDIDENKFRNKVQTLGIANNVFAHGKKYNADKNPFLEQANVFVHPTHEDCFPLVLLEAMQYSLATIASNEGAIREIVAHKESGFTIQKKNATALATKMEVFIKNPELATKMGNEGNRLYKESFTFQTFEKRIISILNEIITETK